MSNRTLRIDAQAQEDDLKTLDQIVREEEGKSGETPPAASVPSEMEAFMAWFHRSAPQRQRFDGEAFHAGEPQSPRTAFPCLCAR